MFRESIFHNWSLILQVNRRLTDNVKKVSDLFLYSLHYQDACKLHWNNWCKQNRQSRDVSIHSRCCCIGCTITWFGGMVLFEHITKVYDTNNLSILSYFSGYAMSYILVSSFLAGFRERSTNIHITCLFWPRALCFYSARAFRGKKN